MLFWTIISLLTAAAVLSVLLPLGRPAAAERSAHESGRAVYLDQLAELERDRAEGRISPEDAEAARAEIGRRLIALEKNEPPPRLDRSSPLPRRVVSLLALGAVPLLSLSLYLTLGAPGLPGQPLAARLAAPAGQSDLAILVRHVEEHLQRAPEDGRGWDVVAPVYLRLGRMEDAARAYRNAVRLLGSTPARETGLGEALLAAQGGVVTAEAREAFVRAVAADPQSVSARFYLALAKEQEGKAAEAAADFRALLAGAPEDAPWRAMVEQRLAELREPAGPDADEVAAAAAMQPAERAAMVEGMVSRLAERLSREPGDVEGWLRLVRAYDVLGRPAEATEAARSALRALPAPEARQRVVALVGDLGLDMGGTETP